MVVAASHGDQNGSYNRGRRSEGMRVLDAISARVENAWFAIRDEESGQTLTEYALIIALVAVATVAAVGFFGGKLVNLLWQEGSSVGNTT